MVSHSCGISLFKNIVTLAIIDLVLEVIGVCLTTVHLISVVKHAKELRKTSAEGDEINDVDEINDGDEALYLTVVIALATHTLHVALFLFQTGLSILLLFGAFQKHICKCRIWLNITALIVIITVASTVVNHMFGSETKRPGWSIGSALFLFLYKGYMIWIVHSFIKLIRFNNHTIRYEIPAQDPESNEKQDDLLM